MINIMKLALDLADAGLPVVTVRETGEPVVEFARELSEAEHALYTQMLAAHDPDEMNKLKAQILALAQSAVGVKLDALTAAQRNALVAMLLFKGGAISKDLTIKPLSQWCL